VSQCLQWIFQHPVPTLRVWTLWTSSHRHSDDILMKNGKTNFALLLLRTIPAGFMELNESSAQGAARWGHSQFQVLYSFYISCSRPSNPSQLLCRGCYLLNCRWFVRWRWSLGVVRQKAPFKRPDIVWIPAPWLQQGNFWRSRSSYRDHCPLCALGCKCPNPCHQPQKLF